MQSLMSHLLLAFSLALPGHASAADMPLPGDTRLLPLAPKLAAGWLLDKLPSADCDLLLDPKGNPWPVCGGHFVVAPFYGRMFTLNDKLDSAAWLENGAAVAAAGEDLLLLPLGDELKGKAAKGMETLKLKRLAKLPLEKARLARAGADSFYLYGRDRKTGTTQVFAMKLDGKRWKPAFVTATKASVSGVAGDGKVTFLAVGRKVLRVEGDSVTTFYTHPADDISGLAYSAGAGLLFYSTGYSVGYASEGRGGDFLLSPSPSVKTGGGKLCVLLAGGKGVLRIEGISSLNDKAAAGVSK